MYLSLYRIFMYQKLMSRYVYCFFSFSLFSEPYGSSDKSEKSSKFVTVLFKSYNLLASSSFLSLITSSQAAYALSYSVA